MNKLSILKVSLIAAVLALASTPSTLNAQSSPNPTRVKVPFAFAVGSTHFEPGVYTIGMLYGSNVLMFATQSIVHLRRSSVTRAARQSQTAKSYSNGLAASRSSQRFG